MRYKVPNWAQACLAKAAGLDPEKVAVEHDGDTTVTFLQYIPRKRILVSKADGSVITRQDQYAECRKKR